MFTLKNMCEKYLANERDLYVEYKDLEKVYNMGDINTLWKVCVCICMYMCIC